MISIRLTRCETYTLIPHLFVKGKVYQVSDEMAKDLLSKADEFGVSYFEEVDLNTSSTPSPGGEAEEKQEAPAKKTGARVTI